MMYQTLAHYYDALVRDDEAADAWVDWIRTYAKGGSFLELACGSGEITLRLKDAFALSAMDLSQDMIEQAQAKPGAEDVTWSCGNMLDLSGYGTYDAIGCFCDSFNYILSEEEAESFFAQCAEHLNPGGWFLFDTHSLDRLEEFEEPYEETGTFADGLQVQWVISAEEDRIYQDFAFYCPERTITENHIQKVYHPDWLLEQLQKHFDVVEIRTDFTEPGIAPGEKYFYACHKPEAEH